MRFGVLASGLSFLLLLGGCSNDTRETKVSPVPKIVEQQAKAPVIESIDLAAKIKSVANPKIAVEPWGAVNGRIVWGDDKPPKREPVRMDPKHNDRNFCLKNGE